LLMREVPLYTPLAAIGPWGARGSGEQQILHSNFLCTRVLYSSVGCRLSVRRGSRGMVGGCARSGGQQQRLHLKPNRKVDVRLPTQQEGRCKATRKVDVRLPGKGKFSSHGARLVR